MSGAEFTIEGTAFAQRGYDAASGDMVHLQLADLTGAGIQSCIYVQTRKTKGAPDLSPSAGGVASPPSAAVAVTMPSGTHSWQIDCITNNGAGVPRPDGTLDYSVNRKSRIISIRSVTSTLRKIIVSESVQYSPTGGWADAQNEEIDELEGIALSILYFVSDTIDTLAKVILPTLDPTTEHEVAKFGLHGFEIGTADCEDIIAVDTSGGDADTYVTQIGSGTTGVYSLQIGGNGGLGATWLSAFRSFIPGGSSGTPLGSSTQNVSLQTSNALELKSLTNCVVTFQDQNAGARYTIRVKNSGGVPTFANVTWRGLMSPPAFSASNGAVDRFVIDCVADGAHGALEASGFVRGDDAVGILRIDHTSSATTLAPGQRVRVDTSGGPPPTITTFATPYDGARFSLKDIASTFHVTACPLSAAGGQTIEDPNGPPGTFSASVTLSIESCSLDYEYDAARTRWFLV